ncbi:DNA-binding transcriptional MerR regulator [Paenibacillus shirakamiensis]|uniref:DNA-binding transcriptional MerR regulator n=1 Tax=Paenibacillus shirakamiensis TaxID=1265935 RepID=A0ABS4JMD2_9BACL|nr:MerR family transcriptional regulator [Paenibacillus shirakamiensis]MBP2002276.1 DNA-binding transcriptional MerR regulator [Paenibacillus shirakamiensis]
MDHRPQHYVSTGQFANICHVNKKTLFHYDAIGLFKPAFVDDKGYRYYSLNQLDLFTMISSLKELSVPLKEIKTYIDQRTPELILDLSRKKIHEVDLEMAKLSKIKHVFEETLLYTNRGLNAWKDGIRLEEHEEEYIIVSPAIQVSDSDNPIEWLDFFTNFEHLTLSMNTSFVGSMVSREHVLAGRYESKSHLFAKTKTDEDRQRATILVKPKGKYAVTFHHGGYDTIGATYEKLLVYITDNKLSMGEFSFEEYLIDEVGVQQEKDYVTQISLEVK